MNNEFWMSNLTSDISKRCLNYLIIPGSHDSFTCNVNELSETGPDVRDSALKLINWFGYYGKLFLKSWLITQNISATDQLIKGVRYFDLRIGKIKKDNVKLFITHQLFSGKLEIYLNEILQFLIIHSKEVVLLDFNHIYLDKEEHCLLINMIIEIFGEKIASFSKYQYIPTLDELWQNKHQVLIFYHCEDNIDQQFWPQHLIPSYWPDTTDVNTMITFANNSLKEKTKEKFHILQGILTPNSRSIAFHPLSTLQNKLADNATKRVVEWLNNLEDCDKVLLNIVIVDFVQEHLFIDTMVQLNYCK